MQFSKLQVESLKFDKKYMIACFIHIQHVWKIYLFVTKTKSQKDITFDKYMYYNDTNVHELKNV